MQQKETLLKTLKTFQTHLISIIFKKLNELGRFDVQSYFNTDESQKYVAAWNIHFCLLISPFYLKLCIICVITFRFMRHLKKRDIRFDQLSGN